MGNVEVNNKELSEVKNRYKKLKNIIIIILFILIGIFLINEIHDIYILNKILKYNVDVDCGNNYKVVRNENGDISEFYLKDDRSKHVGGNGKNVMMWTKDSAYIVLHDTKEYFEFIGDEMPMKYMGGRTTVTFFPSIMVSKQDIDSLFELLDFKYSFRINIDSEVIEGKDYYVLETDVDIKMWFSKEDYKFLRELNYGRLTTIDIEKDVVADEEMKTPIELGYTEKEKVKTQSN